jgi:hypothetical protein
MLVLARRYYDKVTDDESGLMICDFFYWFHFEGKLCLFVQE